MTEHALSDSTVQIYNTVNPATGSVVEEIRSVTDEELESLVEHANNAFLEWREVTVSRRVDLFRVIAKLIEVNKDPLARQITIDMGKPLAQSGAEVDVVASIFRYYADLGPALLADELIEVSDIGRAVVRREAVGVVLGIEPWNLPLYQAMRVAAPNLMLGNTVLLKPSEITASSTRLLDRLFTEAGFPAHVYATALISQSQASALITDSRIRAVTLTGSNRAGAAVGAQASRNFKPVVLELGGSDAFVVLDSANIDHAAVTAAMSRLRNGGQVCHSPKRIIVTEKVADQFIAKFVETFTNQIVGDPLIATTTVGPLSSAKAAYELHAQYEDAVDKGATILVPGGRIEGPGAYFQPAIITDITPDMRVYTEEAFGPLAMIYRVADADAAVFLANDTVFGLGGTVFAEDLIEAERVASQLDAGMVGINTSLRGQIEIPFGGTKASGVGRELGRSGMDQFANMKTYAFA